MRKDAHELRHAIYYYFLMLILFVVIAVFFLNIGKGNLAPSSTGLARSASENHVMRQENAVPGVDLKEARMKHDAAMSNAIAEREKSAQLTQAETQDMTVQTEATDYSKMIKKAYGETEQEHAARVEAYTRFKQGDTSVTELDYTARLHWVGEGSPEEVMQRVAGNNPSGPFVATKDDALSTPSSQARLQKAGKITGMATEPPSPGSQGTVFVIVNAALLGQLESELTTFTSDLMSDGYDVETDYVSGATPENIKSLLQSGMPDTVGAILIGDMPIALYVFGEGSWVPTDYFLADLDGTWVDNNSDGIYDSMTGDNGEDIWIGRIEENRADGQEIAKYKEYFHKDHEYRIGNLKMPNRALIYFDDDWDWEADYFRQEMSSAYSEIQVVNDKAGTNSQDYSERLSGDYDLVHIMIHSNADTHGFKLNNQFIGDNLYSQNITQIRPHAIFYNLGACFAGSFGWDDYIAGRYIFDSDYGLAAVAAVSSGAMLASGSFYGNLSEGKSWGESYRQWFNLIGRPDDFFHKEWFYHLVILGDPTLRPNKPNDYPISQINITDYAVVHGNVDVRGKALRGYSETSTFGDYDITYKTAFNEGKGLVDGITLFNNGQNEVDNDTAGTWDTAGLPDATYSLRLMTSDASGLINNYSMMVKTKNACVDEDGDGYGAADSVNLSSCTVPDIVDCDDSDYYVNPAQQEICNQGADNDCNGLNDSADPACNCIDNDQDGYGRFDSVDLSTCPSPDVMDCYDGDNTTYPGAPEICDDGMDNDCNTFIDYEDSACGGQDAACHDLDGDGYGRHVIQNLDRWVPEDPEHDLLDCAYPDAEDCDDYYNLTFPGATEICDDWIDNDCNGLVDNYYDYPDPACNPASTTTTTTVPATTSTTTSIISTSTTEEAPTTTTIADETTTTQIEETTTTVQQGGGGSGGGGGGGGSTRRTTTSTGQGATTTSGTGTTVTTTIIPPMTETTTTLYEASPGPESPAQENGSTFLPGQNSEGAEQDAGSIAKTEENLSGNAKTVIDFVKSGWSQNKLKLAILVSLIIAGICVSVICARAINSARKISSQQTSQNAGYPQIPGLSAQDISNIMEHIKDNFANMNDKVGVANRIIVGANDAVNASDVRGAKSGYDAALAIYRAMTPEEKLQAYAGIEQLYEKISGEITRRLIDMQGDEHSSQSPASTISGSA